MRNLNLVRPILILGGIYFSLFAIVGITLRRLDVADGVLSIVGGGMAYAFLMTIALLAFVRWRRRRRPGR